MAFKAITDLSADTTISLGGTNRKTGKKNPSSVEGYYLGKRAVKDTKKKSGESYIYFFQTSAGNIGVWGKTDIDRKLGAVPLGSMTRVSFDRMVPTPNGEMYKYKVEVDAENTIEVADLSAGAANEGFSASTATWDNDGGEEETATYSDASEDEEDAGQAAALAAAERKAKVEALLRGAKSKVK